MKRKFYKENSTGVALVGVGLNGYSLLCIACGGAYTKYQDIPAQQRYIA